MKLVELPEIVKYRHLYDEVEMQPLQVICRLKPNSPVGAYDSINLDNLLAAAVIIDAYGQNYIPPINDPYVLPIPCLPLWRSEAGLPLFATTCFEPFGHTEKDVIYWHKRAQSGRFTNNAGKPLNINTSSGRWMERRVPMPTLVTISLSASCIGNPEEIVRLLGHIRFVGKKRGIGFGNVDHWIVRRTKEFRLVDEDRLRRPVPLAAAEVFEDQYDLPQPDALVGWALPQWKPSLFLPGWRTGTTFRQAIYGQGIND